MRYTRRIAICLITALSGSLAADASEPFPFPLSHESPDNVVSMRGLLDAPAGKYGFLRSEGEHFVHSNGTVRLNGINLTGPAVFPTHGEADALDDRFARFGFNCVRLHFFDCAYSNAIGITGCGVFVENEFPRRNLDPERVDRLHYLVASLKKRGIYTDVNLRVGRTLDERDGVVFHGSNVEVCKPRLIASHRALDFGMGFYTTTNPDQARDFAGKVGFIRFLRSEVVS